MNKFDKKVLFVGYGSVAQCALPILLKLAKVPAGNITVMDFEDKRAQLAPWLKKGVRFLRGRLTRENLAALLSRHLSAGDLLIDLAWNIDACAILQWCHDHGVLYVNTSTELWDPYAGAENKHPTERTLYVRHMALRKMAAGWRTEGPTAVIEHGANPGLISHFVKKGLVDIAGKLLADKEASGARAAMLRGLVQDRAFNELAMELGVKVIHVSERDTQVSRDPKQVGEFVNTWSVEGFREEGVTTSELGWGTHEKELPQLAYSHKTGPKNQICLARMGMNTWVSSWVPPDHCIHGMVIRHGEAFTLSDRLTVRRDGEVVYRPTVHYAYCPSDAAIASLNELRGDDYKLQPRVRIMNDDITAGADALGALLMGHQYNAWWTGSILDIAQARRLLPHQNATTIQVGIGVIAAALWMMENPDHGLCVPEDLPHDYVLKIAAPWLGKLHSAPSDWTPLKHYTNRFKGHNNPCLDLKDPWQFKNFLITDGD